MAIIPWNENTYFSPCYIINQLAVTIKTGNKDNIKKHKEAWVCAVSLICESKITKKEWWIQIPKNDPPDIFAMSIIKDKSKLQQNMFYAEVEIFEISKYDTNETIEDSIKRKLGKKDYSKMMLVGFVMRDSFVDPVRISNNLKKIKPKALAILILLIEKIGTNYTLMQLFPEYVRVENDISIFCNTTNQKDFLTVRRSTKIENEDLTTNDSLTIFP